MKEDDYLLKAEFVFERFDRQLQNAARLFLAMATAVIAYFFHLLTES